MCGIIGYIGKRQDPGIGLEALKRLEYRGYDSAGFAVFNPSAKKIECRRAVGRVSELELKMKEKPVAGSPFIFHTRWATHGEPTEKNAHPHADCRGEFYVVHNGIVENYAELREWLSSEITNPKSQITNKSQISNPKQSTKHKKQHKFKSDTDTEVLAHLIEHFYEGDLAQAVEAALGKVRGTYGLAVVSAHEPETLVAARLGSPLLIGVGEGEYFVSSDPAGVISYTKQVVYLEDGELVRLTADTMELKSQITNHTPSHPTGQESQTNSKFEIRNSKFTSSRIEEVSWDIEQAQKGGYEHFMLKEIMEQPSSVSETFRGRTITKEGLVKLGGLESVKDKLAEIKKLHIVACGTAYHAGLVGKYMLEEYAGVPTEVSIGSEFRYRKQIIDEDTAVLAISQSGETADTIASLREAKNKGALTLGIVNVVGSTIARETDAGVYNHAGPEIGVASTKAYTSQLTALALLTVFLGRQRQMSLTMGKRITQELEKLPKHIRAVLEQKDAIKQMADKHKDAANMIFLGRKYNYPTALEGALKVKEISYMHAEGYPGGELKHGPLAMIDKDFGVFALMPQDSVYEKMASNIEEVKARGGPVVAVTTKGNKKAEQLTKDVLYIPKTLEMLAPVVATVPTQLFAYYIGVGRGYNVDKPRNLAKSVTVE